MASNLLKVSLLSLLIPLSACNADSSKASKSVTPAVTKAAAPIKQAGGYSNIDNETLKNLIAEGKVVLVDIRRQEEWQQTGIVKGSKTITFFDNMGRINPNFVPEFTAIAKPNQTIALICRTGSRSQAASQAIAQQLGYKNVLNVTHGITGWMAEKRPVVKYK
ncbi:MAG TPA: rhodanese-like domain-containing protein [Leucothrix sp.]|nr:rhodanese-like domain-containing protein [Leucothrix sp.]